MKQVRRQTVLNIAVIDKQDAAAKLLSDHPLVAGVATAPQNQGGGGATIVTLKD